jgi:predicted dehydrogenase
VTSDRDVAEPIRTALVGFGLAGRAFHAPFLAAHPRLRLTHVLQRHGDAAARMIPEVSIVRDMDALLAARPVVQLIVIATPNATHVPLASQALAARRHVVIDKPMAVTVDEGEALVRMAREAGTLLVPYHNRRWDGDFCTVRELLDRRWLGELREFESRFDRFRAELREGAWREQPGPGAGLLFDLGPHLIDQALALFGRPKTVSGMVRAERAGALADDRFELLLDYGALRVSLGAGMLFETPGPRFRISGDAGTYVKHGVDPQEHALRNGAAPGGATWGEDPPDRFGAIEASIDGMQIAGRLRTLPGNYFGFYDNVCSAIDRGAAPAVTPEDGVEVLRCIHLAFESSARGGTPLAY